MSKILVTGGAGFIASHINERLLSDGHEVTAIDNFDPYYDPGIKKGNVARYTDNPDFHAPMGKRLKLSFLKLLPLDPIL